MTRFVTLEISRPDGFEPTRRPEYEALLVNVVFPLVDTLLASGSIYGYDFLSHAGLDLRLWVPDGVTDDDLAAVVEARNIPARFSASAPSEVAEARTHLLDVLHACGDLTRLLVESGAEAREPAEVVHWLLNQLGLHNLQEYHWHLDQAAAWETSLMASAQTGSPLPAAAVQLRRGDVVEVDLAGAQGTEKQGIRPCVVIQNDTGNAVSPLTIVAPITDRRQHKALPVQVAVTAADLGFLGSKDSVIECGHIRTVDRRARVRRKLSALPPAVVTKLDQAIRVSLSV